MNKISNNKFQPLSSDDMRNISGGRIRKLLYEDKIEVKCPPGINAGVCYTTKLTYGIYKNNGTFIKTVTEDD
jgi:hypothetical protein